MINLFRRLRKRLAPKNPLGNYLFYAVGEIVLVVAGILIALSINNWNEERKQQARLQTIFDILLADMENDLEDVRQSLSYYEGFEDEFIALMNGTMSQEQFTECGQCAYLITGHRSFSMEIRGYEALKNYYSENREDTLVNQIVQFYTQSLADIASNDQLITESIAKDLIRWRDQYDWFPRFAQQNETQAYARYATTSKEFRNMTAWRYALIYGNYILAARELRDGLMQFKQSVEQRLRK